MKAAWAAVLVAAVLGQVQAADSHNTEPRSQGLVKRLVWLRRRFNIPLLQKLRPRPDKLDDYTTSSRFFHVYGRRRRRVPSDYDARDHEQEAKNYMVSVLLKLDGRAPSR